MALDFRYKGSCYEKVWLFAIQRRCCWVRFDMAGLCSV